MNKKDKGKDWNKVAGTFKKAAQKDDYQDTLFKELILDKNDTVLDIGCGEGTITIPLAKKVKKVIGLDSAPKMLELLEDKAKKENITNIETVLSDIEDIPSKNLENIDVVIASRSLNGIIPIDETLKYLNEIANKYVFITLFGPENWNFEKEFQKYLGKKPKSFPGYNYMFNILFNMGIYANIKRLNITSQREYKNIEEAMDNGKFRLDLLNNEEKEKLREYLNKNLIKNPKTGKLYSKKD
ncbi:class I SAM-dependent methyltransferase, partial [Methanobrevibacter sp. OttesenSCG-928-K11]|nr:class I SAM-dependent methyltransferase [Methanobrevibacter sp. OttesenSCG-928-K11]